MNSNAVSDGVPVEVAALVNLFEHITDNHEWRRYNDTPFAAVQYCKRQVESVIDTIRARERELDEAVTEDFVKSLGVPTIWRSEHHAKYSVQHDDPNDYQKHSGITFSFTDGALRMFEAHTESHFARLRGPDVTRRQVLALLAALGLSGTGVRA